MGSPQVFRRSLTEGAILHERLAGLSTCLREWGFPADRKKRLELASEST